MGEEQQEHSNQSKRRRRRRRKPASKGGGEQSSSSSNRNSGGQSNRSNSNSNRGRSNNNGGRRSSGGGGGSYSHKTPKDKFGGRDPVLSPDEVESYRPELAPFDLFCMYHVGISDDNKYRKPSARDCAQRLGVSMDEMHDALRDFGLDNNAFDAYEFDISLARLDVRVAPQGIDKREIARVHFDELLEFNPELATLLEARAAEDAQRDVEDYEDSGSSEEE